MPKSFDSEPPWPEMNEEQKVIASIRARLNWAVHDPDPGERRAMVSYFYELGFEAGLSVQKLNELYEEVLSRMLRPREITDEIVYKETSSGEKVQIWPFPLSAADEHGIPPMAPWTERNRPE